MIEPAPCNVRPLLAKVAALTMALCGGCQPRQTSVVQPPALAGGAAPTVAVAANGISQTAQSASPFRLASLPTSLKPVVESRPWKYIVVHHSAAEEGSVEGIDADHRRRKDALGKPWLGIGYHFVIGNGRGMADGLVEPTFRWREQLHGAHAGNRLYNDEGIGICLIGDFEQSEPTPRQTSAARELIACLKRQFTIPANHVLRHSEVNASDCPGAKLPWEAIAPDDPLTLKENDL